MKVKELIKRLQSFDQELDVYVYNDKEHELNLVETANPTSDWGEGENGECDWEDFVTIYTTQNPEPLFTLTAEEVEIVKNAMELQREMALELADALEPDTSHTETTLDNLLTRIKQWQDENNGTD